MQLDVSRVQHGVGQGGFHTSSFYVLNEDEPGSRKHVFELVFDCGTVSRSPEGEGARDFIKERIEAHTNLSGTVDALFISHLDSDHLNGAETLCSVRHVQRVFLPYFQQHELALFIALQVISNDRTTLGPAGLAVAANSLRGAPFFGVPVTLIGGPENEDRTDAPLDATPQRLTLVEIKPSGIRSPLGRSLPSGSQLGLQWMERNVPWTLLPWSYKQSPPGLSQLLADVPQLRSLLSFGRIATAQDMEMLLALRPRIRTALTKIIKAAGGVESADFNAPSICLYSGPSLDQSQIRHSSYLQRGTDHQVAQDDPIGWITTGDAVLGRYEHEFMRVFWQVLEQTGTYVLPHHGSRRNHSSELVFGTRGRFALICAKQGSKFHPHPKVLAELTGAGDDHRVLTEYITHGVQERVLMAFDC